MLALTCIRTNASHKDFIELVQMLDIELAVLDGKDHAFYAQFNTLDDIEYVVLAYHEQRIVGCGAIKYFDKESMEVKRMYVVGAYRNQGVATKVLKELEAWTIELNYSSCVLETGQKQVAAKRLYEASGYCLLPNYGVYVDQVNSVCYIKTLGPKFKWSN